MKSAGTSSAVEAVAERNKRLALEMYEALVNEKDFEKARTYMTEDFVEHSPTIVGGDLAGLKLAIDSMRTEFPASRAEIKHACAEGDMVILHVHIRLSDQDRGIAVADIMTFNPAGKIVTHWDVVQPVPETISHDHGMF